MNKQPRAASGLPVLYCTGATHASIGVINVYINWKKCATDGGGDWSQCALKCWRLAIKWCQQTSGISALHPSSLPSSSSHTNLSPCPLFGAAFINLSPSDDKWGRKQKKHQKGGRKKRKKKSKVPLSAPIEWSCRWCSEFDNVLGASDGCSQPSRRQQQSLEEGISIEQAWRCPTLLSLQWRKKLGAWHAGVELILFANLRKKTCFIFLLSSKKGRARRNLCRAWADNERTNESV